MATDPRSLTGTRVCPKGRKHIDGGEAPVYEKYQIHSPNGATDTSTSSVQKLRNRYGRYVYIFGNTFCLQYEEKYIGK